MEVEDEQEDRGVIDTWQRKHRTMWVGATRHPFILSISDGTIHSSAFKTWLGQDYIFVRAFVGFVGSLLVKAWKESDEKSGDVEVMLSGLSALKEEIEWFKSEANKWSVDLSPQNLLPHDQNNLYCRFLENLMTAEVEYTVAITAFWAIEKVYQESFASCLDHGSKTPAELKDTCEQWGNDAFGEYCGALKSIAERLLKRASDDTLRQSEQAFLRVLEHEVGFWDMSRGV